MIVISEGRFFCYTIFFFSDVEIVTPNLPLPYMGGECLAGFPLEQASDNSRDFCYIDFVHQIPIFAKNSSLLSYELMRPSFASSNNCS